MDESTSWKGHSFTMLVFTGIVVLCSIFFVLGMLVGRMQGQRIAETAAAAEETVLPTASAAREDAKPELTFYDSVEGTRPELELPPPPPEPDPEPVTVAAPVVEEPPVANSVNLQIRAVRRLPDANDELEKVKAKGFTGFILSPAPGDSDPWYRIQVGPYTSATEAELAKRQLEELGYQPILRK